MKHEDNRKISSVKFYLIFRMHDHVSNNIPYNERISLLT